MVDHPAMKAFIAVAETRSFTRAALRLNMSQPAVSRIIQRLEDQIDVKLFERDSHQVRLTKAGDALVGEARQISERWRMATANARRLGKGKLERLRIGVCPSAEQDIPQVARGLQSFREVFPKIEVVITRVGRTIQAEALRTSKIDLGLMQCNSSDGLSNVDRTGTESSVISRTPLMVATPTAWNIAETSLKLPDLGEWPWVAPHPTTGFAYEAFLELCRNAGFEPKIAAFINDILPRNFLIASGQAAALAYSRSPVGGIHYLPLEDMAQVHLSETALVWAEGVASPLARVFVDIVRQAPARNGRSNRRHGSEIGARVDLPSITE